MPRLSIACLIAFQLLVSVSTHAAEESWVGKKVMSKKGAIDIRIVDNKKDWQVVGAWTQVPVTVLKEDGRWIKIRSFGVVGWVAKADAVFVENAVDYFTDRIRAHENDDSAYNCRGIAWNEIGEYDLAIKDFNDAIRLDPKYSWAYLNRGNAWHAKKDYDNAIMDYDEAIRLDPKNAAFFNNRGNAWSRKKDYDIAIMDFDEAIRLNPKYASAFYNKACGYALNGKTDLAIDNLRQSLELGYSNFKHIEKDSDLDSIRDDARYKMLVEKYDK